MIVENFEDFKKRNLEAQENNAKNRIETERKKIAGIKKKKLDSKMAKMKSQKQDLMKKMNAPPLPPDVGGGNYFK